MLRYSDVTAHDLQQLLAQFGLLIKTVENGVEIPGSYWGEEEAGLVGDILYLRGDTPIHSVLHEACHYICLSPQRRATLHTDAGGTDVEENGVCYLQILLADQLPFMDSAQMMRDMDTWGYSFREGLAKIWFESDAEDALEWLINHQILDANKKVLGINLFDD